jgi:hypothetical protein
MGPAGVGRTTGKSLQRSQAGSFLSSRAGTSKFKLNHSPFMYTREMA